MLSCHFTRALVHSPIFHRHLASRLYAVTISVPCSTADDIEALGAKLGRNGQIQDVLLLKGKLFIPYFYLVPPICTLAGDLGAGKTCFSRGFIRSQLEDFELRVTSPSYLLDNSYEVYNDDDKVAYLIHHMDLYRLPTGCDLTMLRIPEIYSDSICLIEWPQRMAPQFHPESYLEVDITIDVDGSERRHVRLTPSDETWEKRLRGLQL